MAKLVKLLTILAILAVAVNQPVFGDAKIVLDDARGVIGNLAMVDYPIRLTFRLEYTSGLNDHVVEFHNKFRVWTERNGAYTDNFTPITFDTIPITPPWFSRFDLFVNPYGQGVDGIDEDTAVFYSSCMMTQGFEDGFNQLVWYIETTPTVVGDTLCIDRVALSYYWEWYTDGFDYVTPDWGGPYCFEVVDPDSIYVCGDCNKDRAVNIIDITYLIQHLYFGGPAPGCPWD